MQHENKEMFFRPLIKINVIEKNNDTMFSDYLLDRSLYYLKHITNITIC